MRFSNDGLTLWSDPEQAATMGDQPVSITIGVHPASPNNRVIVRYRVNGGRVSEITGLLVQSDPIRNTQSFLVSWPYPMGGETVEYIAILTCAGRQTPDIQTAHTFPFTFQFSQPYGSSGANLEHPYPKPAAPLEPSHRPYGKNAVKLDYLCTVKVEMSQPPEIIGETPAGLKVNWFLQTGKVYGPKLNATICPKGGDWMTIRPDGVGLMDVRATLKTQEGALISAAYSGVFDLGPDGYGNFLQHQWPDRPPVRSTPRFLTGHTHYQWLNRLQCIGVGEVNMPELLMIYDLYAL